MRFGLLAVFPVRTFAVAIIMISAASQVPAQNTDSLAIPVRKNSSSEDESGRSSSARDDAPEQKASDADLALVRDLRKNSSFYTLDSRESGDSKDSSDSNVPSAKSSRDSDSDESSSEGTGTSTDSDAAAAPETPPVGHYEMASAQPVSAPAISSVAVSAPARVAPITPNLYLPQPVEKESFLSRLFNRKKSTSVSRSAQPYFNSDYATRDSDVILPTVLQGNGYNGHDLPIGGEDPYRLASLPSTFRPTDLVKLPVQSCHYGNQLYLRREAAASLCNMINAAASQGLTIRVVSAYRDIGHQTRLYNKAVARGGEDQKSVARPGKSEHNLGTTVDLTNDEAHCLQRSFGDTAEGQWLAANAERYGWKMTVMSSNARRSHNDEPWHLRYLGSAIDGSPPISTIAQSNSPRQRLDVFGSIGRFLHLRR